MRIGLLHYSGPPIVGGVEQTLHYHSLCLTDMGFPTHLIVGQGGMFDDRIPVEVLPEMFSKNKTVLAVKEELDLGHRTDNFDTLQSVIQSQLEAALQNVSTLIVHNVITLHKNIPLTAALWALHTAGRAPPIIGWHHDLAFDREQYRNELHRGYPWDLLRTPWPDVINVVVSETQRTRLAQLYATDPASIHVIPPGIDPVVSGNWTENTRRLVDELDLLQADAVLLLPARITRRKNIEFALHILAELRSCTHQDVRLIVTGPPGPHNPANVSYYESLLTKRRALDLDRAAHFIYELDAKLPLPLDESSMANLYSLCDALLFPSRQEGFGIPLLEAGFTRLPIYCSDIEPFHESVENRAHYFSLEASPKSVAEDMARTLFSRRSFQLQRHVRRLYSWEGIVSRKMLPLLESMNDA